MNRGAEGALGCMSKLIACLFLFLFSIPSGWAQRPAPDRSGSSYIGSDSCQPCHDDIYKAVSESAHQDLLESRQSSQRGCESCHGPGSAHVNGNGDASKIFRFGDASAEAVRARCGECHQNFMGQDAGHQKLSCLACHSAHHYQQKKFLLALGKEQLCQNCH
jgi:hypothetical protein